MRRRCCWTRGCSAFVTGSSGAHRDPWCKLARHCSDCKLDASSHTMSLLLQILLTGWQRRQQQQATGSRLGICPSLMDQCRQAARCSTQCHAAHIPQLSSCSCDTSNTSVADTSGLRAASTWLVEVAMFYPFCV